MKALGRYDTELQMFVEEDRQLDTGVLTFWRWLVANGRLDDDTDTGAREG